MGYHGVRLYNPGTKNADFGGAFVTSPPPHCVYYVAYLQDPCSPPAGLSAIDVDYSLAQTGATNEWIYYRVNSAYGFPVRGYIEAHTSGAGSGYVIRTEVQISGVWYFAGRHALHHMDPASLQYSPGQYISNWVYLGRTHPNPTPYVQHLHFEIAGHWLGSYPYGTIWGPNDLVAQLWA